MSHRNQYRNRDAQTDLIESHDRAIRRLAFQVGARFPSVDLDDLIQEGRLALLEAAGRHEVAKGTQIWTLAQYRVRGAMLAFALTTSSTLTVPASTLEHRATLAPSTSEAVDRAMRTGLAIVFGEDEGPGTVPASSIPEGDLEPVRESTQEAHRLLAMLPPREATVLRLAFGIDGSGPKTDAEVADVIGVSRPMVQRIRTRAVNRLRGAALAEEILGTEAPEVTDLAEVLA